MTEIINPFNCKTDIDSAKFLATLLTAYPHIGLLKKSDHKFKDEQGNVIEFHLTHHLIRRKRLNKKGIEGERFEVLSPDPIGKGGFGTIYPCITFEIKDGKFVPIEKIKPRLVKLMDKIDENKKLTESEIYKFSDDFYIGQFFDYLRVKPPVTDDKNYLAITMKDLECPNLADFLNTDRDQLTADDLLDITLAITHACKGMKKLGVIHSDFKSANLLIDPPERVDGYFTIYPIDFQFSQFEPEDKKNLRSLGGTYSFQSPETRHHKIINRQTELYSLGVVLYLLFFERNENELDKLLEQQIKNNQPFIHAFDFKWPKDSLFNENHQQLIVALIKSLLSEDPRKRPSLEAINKIIKTIQYDLKYPQESVTAETDEEPEEPTLDPEEYASSDQATASQAELDELIPPLISQTKGCFFSRSNAENGVPPITPGNRMRAQSC